MDKSKEKIGLMFDEIAPSYDKLNHLFTANIDIKWRKEIIRNIRIKNEKAEKILDLASGTGDLTKELLDLNPEFIAAADISGTMLEIQKRKINDSRLMLVQADVQNLPFENNYFDLITIGFGIRNFDNINSSLIEIKRVLKPGGLLVILEMFKSVGLKNKLFGIYFGKVMPYLGNKISKSKAYSYLYESVKGFYTVRKFNEVCAMNGFIVEESKNNFLNIVNTVYLRK